MSDEQYDRATAYMGLEGTRIVHGIGVCPTDPELGSDPEGRRGILLEVLGYPLGTEPAVNERGNTILESFRTLWSLEYMAIMVGTVLAQVEILGDESAYFFTKTMTEALERHRKELQQIGPMIGTMFNLGGLNDVEKDG